MKESRDRGEGCRPSEARDHQRALTAPAIHLGTDDQAEEEIRHGPEGAEDTDLDRCGVQNRDDEDLEGHQSVGASEPTYGRGAPEVHEGRCAKDLRRWTGAFGPFRTGRLAHALTIPASRVDTPEPLIPWVAGIPASCTFR